MASEIYYLLFTIFIILIGTIVCLCKNIHDRKKEIDRKESVIRMFKNKYHTAEREIGRKENVIKIEKVKKNQLSIFYFIEQEIKKGFLVSKNIVKYKMQLLVNKIPVGQPSLIKKDVYKQIDSDEVNRLLDNFAKPLLDAGICVLLQKLPTPVKKRKRMK